MSRRSGPNERNIRALILSGNPIFALKLLGSAHALDGATLDSATHSLRSRLHTEESCNLCDLEHRVLEHVLVTKKQKIFLTSPSGNPTPDVFSPGPPISGTQSSAYEVAGIVLERICVVDMPIFSFEIVVGECHVARIPNDVNHSLIAGIKILMTLDDSRPGDSS